LRHYICGRYIQRRYREINDFKDAIQNVLNDNTRGNALDFADFIESNAFASNKLGDTLWQINYKENCICYIHLDGAATLAHLVRDAMIFGKEYSNICNSAMAFCNPEEAALDCLKKVLEMRKNIIDNEV